MGVMVFLEDITQIQKVQRMEAWREVARRIAHEIKNPLTPIQLSAERLRKRYGKLLDGNGAILDKCTSTIIQQVDELKNLVNEFSHFARLPSAHLTRSDLNGIVQEALFLFKEGHNDIHFQFRNEEIPPLNWTENRSNALLSIYWTTRWPLSEKMAKSEWPPVHDPSRGVVYLEVADNGCGVAPEVRGEFSSPISPPRRMERAWDSPS